MGAAKYLPPVVIGCSMGVVVEQGTLKEEWQ